MESQCFSHDGCAKTLLSWAQRYSEVALLLLVIPSSVTEQ
jgi:hypothetical protein